jgi:Fic family protein
MSDNVNIRELKATWGALQPLQPDREKRLWQKLRLEWNYHSNHIEGNTLTYGETELLLLHDQTHGTHDIREYVEMKAHDLGIEHLRKLAADSERGLSESDIRDLNKIILKEPFWKPTETADGQPSRKQIIPGEYKTTANNVRTVTGEVFEFAAPNEVPAKMKVLVDWLSTELERPMEDVATVAAKLHHDFVLIHPFDDGNGRVARMLVNYLLLRSGYPPIIIPTEQKKTYLAALRLADAGDIAELVDYLRHRIRASLEMAIRAAKGEDIAEPGDIEKEIVIFVRSQEPHREKVQPKSPQAIKKLYENGLKDLIVRAQEKMKAFEPLFLESNAVVDPQRPAGNKDALQNFHAQLAEGFKKPKHFRLTFIFANYRGEAKQRFACQVMLQIIFEPSDYKVSVGNTTLAHKLYTEPLLSDERDKIIERLLKVVLDDIKAKSGQK